MKNQSISLIFVAACLFSGCRPSRQEPVSDPPFSYSGIPAGYYNIATIMDDYAPNFKTVTLDAATGGSFYGNSGSRYIFPPNAFVTQSGDLVTGNVQITVKEVLNESDMVFSGYYPVSNGAPLASGGQSFTSVTQNGNELKLASGKAFEVRMPQPGIEGNGMSLFVGNTDTARRVNWNPAPSAGSVFSLKDTLGLSAMIIGWNNTDRFLKEPLVSQDCTITINSGDIDYSEDSILIAALFDDVNGAYPIHRYSKENLFGETHTYTSKVLPSVPVHFMAFAIIKGNFYGALLPATPKTGENYTLKLQYTSPASFRSQVMALK